MSETPDVKEVPIPDVTPDDAPSDGLSCVVCGKPLEYAGRGRRPTKCEEHKRGAGTGTRGFTQLRTPGDVNQALATLQGVYDGLALGLSLVSSPAAATWASNVPALQEQNRIVLTSDKQLCAAINRFGSKSGKASFVIAHVVAAAPVIIVAQQDVAKRAADRLAVRQAAEEAAEAEAAGL